MNNIRRLLAIFAGCITPLFALAANGADSATIDDFSDPKRMAHGFERLLIDDNQMGSKSRGSFTCLEGIAKVEGELVPGRGLPAFVSFPLLLSAQGAPQDVSKYEGVRLRLRLKKGIVTVQVSSADIQNFDFHTSAAISSKRAEFQEIKVPFKEMKRAWSEQTPLNLKNVTSVNLVVAGVAKSDFSYELDEIGFY